MNKFLALILILLFFSCTDSSQEEKYTEIQWNENLDVAFLQASNTDKIIMIDFMAEWCPPCQKMDLETFSNESVIKKSHHFIPIRIDVDKYPKIAQEYNGNARKYGGRGIPNILFLDKEKNAIRHIVGFHDSEQLIAVMDSVLTGL